MDREGGRERERERKLRELGSSTSNSLSFYRRAVKRSEFKKLTAPRNLVPNNKC